MIKTVIFDLDGTLLYTLEDLKEAVNFALLQFNYPIRSLEEIRCFVGNGVKKLIERSVPENCTNTEDCLKIFKKKYSEIMYNHTKPYNGILEILNKLQNETIKIGVVSNKFDSAVKELCEKYFGNLIDIAIGQADDVPKKPAPNGVFKAMRALNADKNSTVYIGDSDVDVQTAKNSNLPCIGVLWGFRDKENLKNADFLAKTPYDIIKIIRSI